MKIACFTAVRGRELLLRSCLMQMLLQTRRPDQYLLLVNGEDAEAYDRRLITDLLEPWITVVCVPRSITTREASTRALELLLESDADLFCKIDSDDVYFRGYLQAIVAQIELLGLRERNEGFCVNLIDQLWINSRAEARATIHPYTFRRGLGLGKEEERRGVRVGAPPTYVCDRAAAQLLVRYCVQPPYAKISSDDRAWRTVLFEHGIVIEQVRTPQPVFGYLRHSDNTCAVKAAKKTAK